ncbi:MAG: DUF1569 domain-containing protein [Bacteroidota bacterium]
MKSFFDDGVYNEICQRLEHIGEDTQPLWGKMNAAQMMHHCQMPLNIILEKEDYGIKPNWLINLLFKKTMYSDKLWKKNMPTARGFKVNDQRNFKKEKDILMILLKELNSQRTKVDWQDHPAFGKLSKDQWGKMQYKHLDHHIRQFGF